MSFGHLQLQDAKVSESGMRRRKYSFPKLLSEKDLQVDESRFDRLWKEGKKEERKRWREGERERGGW